MDSDTLFMRRALELAKRGEGLVEPNPMVGCVIVRNGTVSGEGFHAKFGGPHAEVEAIRAADGDTIGATCYVTLEPCSHHGKTPPCTKAVLAAGFKRLVVAMRDPHPQVNGRGLQILREAGLEVIEGVLEDEARSLNAPYLTRIEKNRPWIIAKWAMTLDGRLASRTGSSQWISNAASREIVHRLRSRMDAILIGSQTALRDDPLLTVRLSEGTRQPQRIVFDSKAQTPLDGQLVRTAKEVPVLIVVGPDTPRVTELEKAGCEILHADVRDYRERFERLFEHLVQRGITNLLVEGGGGLFGALFDLRLIDEVHAFIAPKLIGGDTAVAPIGGIGLAAMPSAAKIDAPEICIVDGDVYMHGRVRYP